jgi:hypothetical protein
MSCRQLPSCLRGLRYSNQGHKTRKVSQKERAVKSHQRRRTVQSGSGEIACENLLLQAKNNIEHKNTRIARNFCNNFLGLRHRKGEYLGAFKNQKSTVQCLGLPRLFVSLNIRVSCAQATNKSAKNQIENIEVCTTMAQSILCSTFKFQVL